jgi:hypothetical protein
LTVRAPGFAEASSNVTVVVSSVREVSVTLNLAAERQTLNVQAQASSIVTQPMDTTSAVHGGAVTAQDLETIPLANRSFANIAYLVPGTEPVEPSDPTKARITAVSFGGSSGLNDVLSVDGGDNSDDYIGGFLQNFSPDAIQEFAVQTSQQNADTGRTVGGSVEITTKRGTNVWHGEAAFLRTRRGARMRATPSRIPASAQTAVLAAKLHRHARRTHREGQTLVLRSIEAVHEDASIAYSPASLTQFDALASLASQGLIPGVHSIAVPTMFRSHSATTGDCASTGRSRPARSGSCGPPLDNYTTDNAFRGAGHAPSTGATWHSNYMNLVLGQQFIFSPTWLGTFTWRAADCA